MNRQQVRRERFQSEFEKMPSWETWIEPYTLRVWANKTVRASRSNFRRIPRRQQREMARIASKRGA